MAITQRIEIPPWILRLRLPEAPVSAPVMLMLHGWLGDEGVMDVFVNQVPHQFLIASPRAIYPSQAGGYSWANRQSNDLSTLEEFRPAVAALDSLLEVLAARHPADYSAVHLMGFSQGAALASAYAILRPERLASLACLSGFVPRGFEELAQGLPLKNKPVFLAHGERDSIVPIETARRGADWLRGAGAVVEFCLGETGHKISAACLRELKEFYASRAA